MMIEHYNLCLCGKQAIFHLVNSVRRIKVKTENQVSLVKSLTDNIRMLVVTYNTLRTR